MVLISSTRLITIPPTKIADLQENDTNPHLVDLSSIVPPKTKAILIRAERKAGTGVFLCFPMSGSTYYVGADDQDQKSCSLITIKNQELKWRNNVANDDWDLIFYGYFVEVVTR